jgi:basic membrane lipoprotein Med (substrate-binding protein (PBP1-ABC) superfamily)
MFSKRTAFLLFSIAVVLMIAAAQCAAPAEPEKIIETVVVKETVEVEKEVVKEVEVEKEVIKTVEVEVEKEVIKTVEVEVEKEVAESATLAIEHFSIIEGTTWSGAHHRAAQRIAEKYPNVEYVYREEVGPDLTVPYAEEMIAEGADIVVGNAEFMGLPLKDIADKYPDAYFVSIIASDLTTKQNFIRLFPRQYQALYLEGLIAGALTETGNIGIVSAFPSVQVIRRQAGFYLGVQDAAELLNKDITVYVKYVGDWYLPTEERDIASTLITQYDVDVLTQQTDSGSPLDVAQEEGIWFVGKDMDIVGFYGWSDTDTVAVSFDTRWEVLYETIVKDWLAGEKSPETVLYLGMDDSMVLADGTEVPTVDIMNDNKVGVDAISPSARPLIPDEIVELVEKRRDQMIEGVWDPFTEHEFVSNGTGLELQGLPIPAAGTVVKPANEQPTAEWLLSKFNFDLEGMVILE